MTPAHHAKGRHYFRAYTLFRYTPNIIFSFDVDAHNYNIHNNMLPKKQEFVSNVLRYD